MSSELFLDIGEVLNYNSIASKKFRTKKGGINMTDMRRITISLPEELDKKILELKKSDHFVRCSYSEIVRQMMEHGYQMFEAERANDTV